MRKLRRLWDWLLPGLIYLDPMVASAFGQVLVENRASHANVRRLALVPGHTFFVQDFMPPPGTGVGPHFGGSTQADHVAGEDAWRRAVAFLQASKVATGKA